MMFLSLRMKKMVPCMVTLSWYGFHQTAQARAEKERLSVLLERGMTKIVGTYTESKHFGFVIPDDKKIADDIFIPKEADMGAVEGHKVVVKITDLPGRSQKCGRGNHPNSRA